MISSWAEDDASAAEKWVAALPTGQLRDSATIALAVAVADSNFEHALGLARMVPISAWQLDGNSHDTIEALYEKAIADDPAHTLAATGKLGRNPILTGAALNWVGEKWAQGDLDGAAQWMQSLSETELQKNGGAVTPILQAWPGRAMPSRPPDGWRNGSTRPEQAQPIFQDQGCEEPEPTTPWAWRPDSTGLSSG